MSKLVPVILTGYGNVGKAFVRLLADKKAICLARYGLDIELKGVLRRKGGWTPTADFNGSDLAAKAGIALEAQPGWTEGLSLTDLLGGSPAGVLADCTPSNLRTGEPQLAFFRAAFERGWHVAAASKGALCVDYKGLAALAKRKGLALKFSGATAAALPTLDVATVSLAGAEILGIDGILTGTTNHILSRLEEGLSFETALREAQAKGIAEPDPSLDIDGWDTAAKILLLANAAAGLELDLTDIKVEGIRGITAEMIQRARAEGKAIKLLGRLTKDGKGNVRVEVGPRPIDASHPLFAVSGTAKGVAFFTDTMGAVVVTGGKSERVGTAAAMLKDIINIYR